MTEEQQLAEGQVQEPEAPPEEGQVQEEQTPSPPQEIDGRSFLKETGFKSYNEAYKSLKEGQATITKKSQREKELERELQDANVALNNLSAQPAPSEEGEAETKEDFFDNPEAAIDRRVDKKVAQSMKQQQMQMDIAEVRGKDPETFDMLSNGKFLDMAFNKNPRLNYLGKAGLEKAVDEAKGLMRQYALRMDSIIKGNGTSQTPAPANETEAEMRARIMAEQEAARSATLPQGGSARGIQRDRDAEIEKAKKDKDPEKLASILLEGMG